MGAFVILFVIIVWAWLDGDASAGEMLLKIILFVLFVFCVGSIYSCSSS